MSEDLLTTLVVAVVMIIGLVGTLVPVLPGLVMMWFVALAYGFSVGFGGVGVTVMVALTMLVLLGFGLGFVLPKRAASGSGATGRSQVVGLIGAVIGFFVIPVIGLVVGALLGILLGEYADKGELRSAWTATLGTAKGFGINALVQFGIGYMMLLLWSVWAVTVVL